MKMFDTFKQEWHLYRAANVNHDDMTIPYNRVITMLSLIKGPAVSSWVDDYLTTLEAQRLLHRMNDEALWNDFEMALNRGFEDTNKIDDVATDLERLKMAQKEEPGEVSPLTKYISKFNELRRKAGWDADAEGTMRYFRQGLTEGLLYSMLKAIGPRPNTLDGWQQLAVQHHDVFRQLTHEMDFRKQRPAWADNYVRKRRRDPDAMDVDTVRVLSPEQEKKWKLHKEGKCFLCEKAGHLARDCPKKKANPNKQKMPSTQV
jgi:Retrotransposon gag protein/Zinc knuckle